MASFLGSSRIAATSASLKAEFSGLLAGPPPLAAAADDLAAAPPLLCW